MNLISYFKLLFNYPDDESIMAIRSLREAFRDEDTFENRFIKDHKFIEATDLYLKEIELIVHENIDFNKEKHNIQNYLKKFEEIELDLSKRFSSNESIIRTLEITLTSNMSPDCIPITLSKIEEAKQIQRMIAEIRERKTKVDERIRELGKNNFYFR